MIKAKLEWESKYSVSVKLIDAQHQEMFATINKLIDIVSGVPDQQELNEVITALVNYKKFHFITEEKYFDEFNYEGSENHKAKHKEFNQKLDVLTKTYQGDSIGLAYALIDFLEDWLIDHLMTEDQKYINCFQQHGLK